MFPSNAEAAIQRRTRVALVGWLVAATLFVQFAGFAHRIWHAGAAATAHAARSAGAAGVGDGHPDRIDFAEQIACSICLDSDTLDAFLGVHLALPATYALPLDTSPRADHGLRSRAIGPPFRSRAPPST